jgi:diguanylate cyclase (GGDEF)-like protein
VHDGDDELHPAEYRWRATPGQRTIPAVYDAASDQPNRVQESTVASDGPSRDPRSRLPAAIAAAGAGDALESTVGSLLAIGAEALGATMGAAFLADPDRAGLTLVAVHGMADDAAAGLTLDAQEPTHPFAEAAVARSASFDREATTPDGDAFTGAYLPLLIGSGGVEASLGSIGFGWAGARQLDEAEREFVSALASLAAVSVDRARLASTAAERSEWFERMAHTDPLTGLANDRTVARIIELELARAGRQGGEVSLAVFDIDDFRATNADGGSTVGDDVLRRVAAVLAESVRLVDTVGRIGGDEFVLVAPGSAGLTVARRVLDGIKALPAVAGHTVSVSAGVARFPADATDSDSLVEAAMAALQQAKDAGRGSVAESAVVSES